jgi:non-specific serine/threonine protein kinase/serine/threonine-protein kinase
MTPERWQQVKTLFNAVLEREPRERTAFLDYASNGDAALRREVESLVAAHTDAGSRYEAPVVATDPMLDRQVGAYRILRRIGEGGMGAVYLASRADDQFRRLAAVKAILPELLDDQTRRRFENERHTLAALEHPNIVKLLDGGTTEDGVPYLVMDYVEGQPIDRYCRDRGLSIEERLALFRTLCGALHYAHQNLIVHRDLKPANILVTPQGIPKLLDFGIAKLLRPAYAAGTVGFTRTVAQPMTPKYASPEQIQGQPITTASDIYALGVLLYTLLAGTHPFERQTQQSCYELEKAICEGEAGKPSDVAPPDLARQLRGDLDTIVETAMRKEQQKRYASAEHLAEDVRRYLDGQPVSARGASWLYRAAKFVRRHRVALGASVVAASLLAALAVKDDIDRRSAERRFEDLRSFANFVINNLDEAMRKGTLPAREALVRKAIPYLEGLRKEAGTADLEREAVDGYLEIANIQGNPWGENIGDAPAARVSADKALEIAEEFQRRFPKDPRARAALALCHERLGDLLSTGPERAAGLAHYQQALSLSDGNPPPTVRILSRIAYVHGEDYDPAAACDSFRSAKKAALAWLGQSPGDPIARGMLALTEERLAWWSTLAGQGEGAEDTVQEAIAIYKQLAGLAVPGEQRNVALGYKTLAEVQQRMGKMQEALANARQSLAASEVMAADNPQDSQTKIDILQETVLLVDLLLANGQRDEARERTKRTLKDIKPLATAPEANRYYLVDYVALLVNTPFPEFATADEKVELARRAVTLMRGADVETLDLLAKAYDHAGRPQEAVATEQKAVGLLPPPQPGRPTDERRRALDETLAGMQSRADLKRATR